MIDALIALGLVVVALLLAAYTETAGDKRREMRREEIQEHCKECTLLGGSVVMPCQDLCAKLHGIGD